jgi:hypothetical protein
LAIEAIGDVWRHELDREGSTSSSSNPARSPRRSGTRAYLDRLIDDTLPRVSPYRDRLSGFRDSLPGADEHGKSPDGVAEAIYEA